METDKAKKVFAENLNFLLKIEDKKQIDLVKDLKLNSSTVSNWCKGIMIPRMDKLQMLANYFDVEVSSLIEDSETAIERRKKHMDAWNKKFAELNTIRIDTKEFTKEEVKEIKNFIEFVKFKHNKST